MSQNDLILSHSAEDPREAPGEEREDGSLPSHGSAEDAVVGNEEDRTMGNREMDGREVTDSRGNRPGSAGLRWLLANRNF